MQSIKKSAIKVGAKVVKFFHNKQGWKTNRKIVVIESDDWGSIRMPCFKTYSKLIKKGYKCYEDPYLKYDSLASEDDLSALFDILKSIKDVNNKSAVITANSVVANPNFQKIKEDNFNNYYYELFINTLKKYPSHDNSFNLWKQGIDNNIFKPQYHGREHLNTFHWIRDIKTNDILMEAFNNNMISISSEKCKLKSCYMESLDYYSKEESLQKSDILIDGVNIFKELFGVYSESFIANCYVWNKENERVLSENKVKFIQGIPLQYQPKINNNKHSYKKVLHYTGQKNKYGQTYLVRNVHFEPSVYKSNDIVGECLKKIENFFKINRPVIISSHRLNFIGSIHEYNRKQNLKLFKLLLQKIVDKWPDVEFMTSDELGNLITKSKN